MSPFYSYGLDGPGIESWGEHPSRPVMGSTQLAAQGVPGLFPGCNAAEIKERIELYLHTPSGPFMACSKVSFTFTSLILQVINLF